MQKLFSEISFLIFAFSLIFFINSCGSEENSNNNTDTLKILQTRSFSVSDYNFAILEGDKFIQYNKAIYHRGDEVYLVLEDVGPFARGVDSLNHAEMKLEVTDAIGQIITIRENIFGARGHNNFPNNMLSSPYASFSSGVNDKPGKYSMSVTVYDLVRKDSIVVYDDFFLE